MSGVNYFYSPGVVARLKYGEIIISFIHGATLKWEWFVFRQMEHLRTSSILEVIQMGNRMKGYASTYDAQYDCGSNRHCCYDYQYIGDLYQHTTKPHE